MYPLLPIFIALAFGILAWRDLRLAVVLLLGLLPTYLLRFSVGPIPTTLLEVLVVITIVTWVIKERPRINLRHIDPWARAGLLLLAAASFGVVVAPDTLAAFGIWKAYFIEPFLLFLIIRSTLNNSQQPSTALNNPHPPSSTINHLYIALALSATAISLVAIFQYVFDIGIPAPWDIERRVTGVFPYPNALGLFVAPIVSACVVLLASSPPFQGGARGGYARVLLAACALLGAVAIVLAKTEAALVAIPAALIITFFFATKDKRKKIGLTVLGGTMLVVTLLIPFSRSKLLLEDYSGGVRRAQWSETVQMLADRPIFGAGLSGYPTALAPYHDPTLYEIFQYPHNLFLNIWTELGLLGLVAFFWMSWLVLRTVLGRHGDAAPTALQLAALAALLTMTIHGLVDVPYFKNDLAILAWIFIAILATRIDRKQKIG